MRHILTITDKDITGSDKLSSAQPRIAVNAALFNSQNNIALSYMGKYDLHTLPGGGVESGESFQAAVKREMWEETGCECEIIGELGQIIENRSEHDFTQERSYYIARVVGEKGSLHLTEEEVAQNTTALWYPLEQALKIISEKRHDNYQRKFIQKRDIAALTAALLWPQIHDIPGYENFIKIEPLTKGWSSDKKYVAETADGQRFLLRIADISEHDRKKTEFEMMRKVEALNVPMQHPVDFGVCNSGKSVYTILSWVEGEDAETLLPRLSEARQYALGLKSGEILRKIHSVPAPEMSGNGVYSEDWETRFNHKTDRRIQTYYRYREQALSSGGEEYFLAYIENNRQLLKGRPKCYQHGDYHPGNMIIAPDGSLAIIDWNRDDFGDPWEEFNRITFTAHTSPHFATGQLDGYFNGEPPEIFFRLLAFYIASNQLGVIGWAQPFGKSEVDFAMKQNEEVLRWYDNMNTYIPSWYLRDWKAEK